MCGRFSIAIDSEDVQTELMLGEMPESWNERFNIAPTQLAPIVRDSSSRAVEMVRWGLVPYWAKDPKIGYSLINARAESVADKPSFKSAFKSKRCLVLTDGFYEWKSEPANPKIKTPYYYSLKSGRPFTFAGLWDHWEPKPGQSEQAMDTFTIITCPANALVAQVHDRMPVMFIDEKRWRWLEETDQAILLEMLQPADPELMCAWQVSRLINSPQHDSADVIKPAA